MGLQGVGGLRGVEGFRGFRGFRVLGFTGFRGFGVFEFRVCSGCLSARVFVGRAVKVRWRQASIRIPGASSGRCRCRVSRCGLDQLDGGRILPRDLGREIRPLGSAPQCPAGGGPF